MVKHTLKKYSPQDRLFIARSGMDGIEYITKSLNSQLDLIPHLIMVDLDSPDSNGLHVLQRVTSDLRILGTHIVVLTMPLETRDSKRFAQMKLTSVLEKPFEHKEIRSVIETVAGNLAGENVVELDENSQYANRYLQPQMRVVDGDEVRKVLVIEDSPAERKRINHGFNQGDSKLIKIEFASSWSVARRKVKNGDYSAIIMSVSPKEVEPMMEFLIVAREAKSIPVITIVEASAESVGKTAVLAGSKMYLVRDSGNYIAVLYELIVNMVERRRLEILMGRANDADKEMLRDVIERAPLMMLRIDETFAIKDCNETFAIASKQLRHSLIGKHIFDILPDLEVLPMISVLEDRVPYSRESFRMKTIGQTHTAATYWDFHCWSIRKSVTSGQEAILIAADVSGRVELELQRERFVAALAHDIRNPLVGGQRVIDSILSGKHGEVEPPRAKQLMTSLNKSNQSLLLMLSNLIDVYKFETASMHLQFRTIDLAGVLREQVNEVRHVAASVDIEIDEHIADSMPEISGDINSVRRLLMNLLHNALKYSSPKTKIEVRAYAIGTTFVTLKIKNHGSAIAIDKMKTLFRSVVDGVPIRHGSGLGLYLCRKIIEAHGATIDCKSTASGVVELRVNFVLQDKEDSQTQVG